jgi:hypothetical protein
MKLINLPYHKNWMRNRNTIELLGFWESIYNPNFKPVEFDGFRKQAGLNSFVMTPKKWIESTNAIGIVSKSGRYGGTFAHKDIALEFASWISIEFKLYVIKEFQRLKEEENNQSKLEWNLQRAISKINYRIHTDAIKENLIPKEVTKQQVTTTINLCAGSLSTKKYNQSPVLGDYFDPYNVYERLLIYTIKFKPEAGIRREYKAPGTK